MRQRTTERRSSVQNPRVGMQSVSYGYDTETSKAVLEKVGWNGCDESSPIMKAKHFTMSAHVDRESAVACGKGYFRCGERSYSVLAKHRICLESVARDASPKSSRVSPRVE